MAVAEFQRPRGEDHRFAHRSIAAEHWLLATGTWSASRAVGYPQDGDGEPENESSPLLPYTMRSIILKHQIGKLTKVKSSMFHV